jgi:hypothetical protein
MAIEEAFVDYNQHRIHSPVARISHANGVPGRLEERQRQRWRRR